MTNSSCNLMSNINPKYSILILIPLLLIGGYLFLGSNEQTENDMSNDIAVVEPEPVPEPVVEPVVEPEPDMANPPPASNPSSISILSLDIETNTIIVSVDIEGEFDHWHINLDTQLSESGVAGGVMVTNSYNYKFEDIQPGEHTVYVGAVDSSHSLLGEQVSQTFTIAELVMEEPAPECEFGFAKVEVDMVESCDLIVIREDVFMEINGLFQYKELKIQKGVTVTWKTTEDNLGAGGDVNFHQVYELNGLFDSGMMIKGKSWSYTFDEVGVFEYTCPPHPWMTGTIIVVDE